MLFSIDNLKDYTFEGYISGFFHGAPIEDIYEDNVKSFIAWAIFGKHLYTLEDSETLKITQLFRIIEERYPRFRRQLRSGYNPNVSHCAITLEPVPYIHRPLALYIFNTAVQYMFNVCYLLPWGFKYMEVDGISYWYRPAPARGDHDDAQKTTNTLPPLLIFHGISPGWSLYFLLIKVFSEDRTVILADLDGIKVRS